MPPKQEQPQPEGSELWSELPEHQESNGCPPQSAGGAIPEQQTNALHVRLPAEMAFDAAGQNLSRFGDVMSLEEVTAHSGSGLSVSVVFFDVRAAELAMRTIGAEACKRMPQCGRRTVRMSGEFSLDNESVDCVSNVWGDEIEPGTYMVEFYDTRDAQRVRQQAQQQMPNQMPQQAFLHGDAGGYPAAGPSCEEESSQPAILLRGLPIAVCTPNMLSAMIQQAGLSDHVLQKQVVVGKQCGEVLLTMDSMRTTNYCFGHFHGCCWDASGIPVTAEYMVVPGKSPAPAAGGGPAQGTSKSSTEAVPDQDVDGPDRRDNVPPERRGDVASEPDLQGLPGPCAPPTELEADAPERCAASDEGATAAAAATDAEGGLYAEPGVTETPPSTAEGGASALAGRSAGAAPKTGGRKKETSRGESGQSLSTCDSEAQLEKDMVRHQ